MGSNTSIPDVATRQETTQSSFKFERGDEQRLICLYARGITHCFRLALVELGRGSDWRWWNKLARSARQPKRCSHPFLLLGTNAQSIGDLGPLPYRGFAALDDLVGMILRHTEVGRHRSREIEVQRTVLLTCPARCARSSRRRMSNRPQRSGLASANTPNVSWSWGGYCPPSIQCA